MQQKIYSATESSYVTESMILFVTDNRSMIFSASLPEYETICMRLYALPPSLIKSTSLDQLTLYPDTPFPSILFSIDSKKSVAHYKTV